MSTGEAVYGRSEMGHVERSRSHHLLTRRATLVASAFNEDTLVLPDYTDSVVYEFSPSREGNSPTLAVTSERGTANFDLDGDILPIEISRRALEVMGAHAVNALAAASLDRLEQAEWSDTGNHQLPVRLVRLYSDQGETLVLRQGSMSEHADVVMPSPFFRIELEAAEHVNTVFEVDFTVRPGDFRIIRDTVDGSSLYGSERTEQIYWLMDRLINSQNVTLDDPDSPEGVSMRRVDRLEAEIQTLTELPQLASLWQEGDADSPLNYSLMCARFTYDSGPTEDCKTAIMGVAIKSNNEGLLEYVCVEVVDAERPGQRRRFYTYPLSRQSRGAVPETFLYGEPCIQEQVLWLQCLIGAVEGNRVTGITGLDLGLFSSDVFKLLYKQVAPEDNVQ